LSDDGRPRRNVAQWLAIASLLLTLLGPVPLEPWQKAVLGLCLTVILVALSWWPRPGSPWLRPVWRATWLDPDQRKARRRYRNFRWALCRYRPRLGMSARQLAFGSGQPLWLVCLVLVFPGLIPNDRIRDALLRTLMLPPRAFEHGCRCDRETAIKRFHWYELRRIGVFTERKPSSLRTRTLLRILKSVDSQRRAELRKRRTLR
jgi:hypothetical protein